MGLMVRFADSSILFILSEDNSNGFVSFVVRGKIILREIVVITVEVFQFMRSNHITCYQTIFSISLYNYGLFGHNFKWLFGTAAELLSCHAIKLADKNEFSIKIIIFFFFQSCFAKAVAVVLGSLVILANYSSQNVGFTKKFHDNAIISCNSNFEANYDQSDFHLKRMNNHNEQGRNGQWILVNVFEGLLHQSPIQFQTKNALQANMLKCHKTALSSATCFRLDRIHFDRH